VWVGAKLNFPSQVCPLKINLVKRKICFIFVVQLTIKVMNEQIIRQIILMSRQSVCVDGTIDMSDNLEEGYTPKFTEDQIVEMVLTLNEDELNEKTRW
jgi:hypothetical protein